MNNDELTARFEVIELIAKYARAMDMKDWSGISRLLADKLDIDYSAATGQPAAEMGKSELVATLRTLLDRPQLSVQTLTSNHIVEINGATASSVSDFAVVHRTDAGKTFEVRGRYTFGFKKDADWQINKIHIFASWASGDPSIIGLG